MSDDNSSRIVRFGVFEVDLRAGELRRGGQKMKLQEQPFQVLAALLERPGEVVTREELRGKLWPADTFVDFDHSLNAAIKRLRDALGESAERPIFVETVARRGYRFIAPVDDGSGGVHDISPDRARLEPSPALAVHDEERCFRRINGVCSCGVFSLLPAFACIRRGNAGGYPGRH